ncbi:hypothetical protein O0235_01730 [Tepidiforma flava]|uniref:Shikimate dehydrogenase substrate binding N-terminal domain-containing protein n=1 Tax=Tepidiforma flava TaxID=3004094 RepID=A0ABY7M9G9_9CHLR|nr:hypothetical protein [Tepidiforma flava]WBL36326.1 hypothetical protein O0235_01730 [Tepidiforma flava]
MTRRAGIIGSPVSHSLSPVFQQAAFAHSGLDVVYERWETPLSELPARVAALRAPDVLGANVTVPHKEHVIPLLDEVGGWRPAPAPSIPSSTAKAASSASTPTAPASSRRSARKPSSSPPGARSSCSAPAALPAASPSRSSKPAPPRSTSGIGRRTAPPRSPATSAPRLARSPTSRSSPATIAS